MQARLIREVGTITHLRRYSRQAAAAECPATGHYHNASAEVARDERPVGGIIHVPDGKGEYAGDPRWPVRCEACSYVFAEDDEWQVFTRRRYDTASERPEAGDLFWLPAHGADGEHPTLMAICPNGASWNIDGRSSNGPGWTRTGDPPNITVAPSIWVQWPGPEGYHGFLQNGVWTPDLEGRTYPAGLVARDWR